MSLLLFIAYFLASYLVGAFARRRGLGHRDYALGPGLGSLGLLATMAATNFSAFTVFGLSGAGYRIGWAYYPVMGIGTGLMALSFFLIGMPIRKAAAEKGWISPADFVRDRFGSEALAKTFSLTLLLLTLPYLATQAIAGARMLELVTGMPYALGSLLVVGVTTLYTLQGGFRSVAATDGLQLLVLLGGAAISFAAILGDTGGFVRLGERLAAEAPGLLERGGAGGSLPLAALLGTWLLWFLADPLFPQLFQRFYAARDERSLARSAAFYPLVTGGIFFLTIGIGVTGAILLPGLSGSATEQVFTRLAMSKGAWILASVFVLAALAALMSTMDSQLLTLSTMLGRDFAGAKEGGTKLYRGIALALALAAFLASLRPPALILDLLTRVAFPGYAALAPIVFLGVFGWGGTVAAWGALVSGGVLVGLETAGLLNPAPIPQAAFNLGVQILVISIARLVEASIHGMRRTEGLSRPFEYVGPLWLAGILALVLATAGIEAYGTAPQLVGGLPYWVWLSMVGCVGLSLLFALWRKPAKVASARRDGGKLAPVEAPPTTVGLAFRAEE